MSRTARIVRTSTLAAYLVAGAGFAAALSSGLLVWLGDPWGTVVDVAMLVMTLAIAPLMLAFYELGGWTPTPLARAAQALGWIAALTWSVLQVLHIAGAVTLDFESPARGASAVWAAALLAIGSWVAGANLLAGPWLGRVRWAGVVSGSGVAALGIGLLLGGENQLLTYVGGILYQFGIPIWALLMAGALGRLTRSQPGPSSGAKAP
jgi:hypothetical protein